MSEEDKTGIFFKLTAIGFLSGIVVYWVVDKLVKAVFWAQKIIS